MKLQDCSDNLWRILPTTHIIHRGNTMIYISKELVFPDHTVFLINISYSCASKTPIMVISSLCSRGDRSWQIKETLHCYFNWNYHFWYNCDFLFPIYNWNSKSQTWTFFSKFEELDFLWFPLTTWWNLIQHKQLPQIAFLWVHETMKVFLSLLNETTINKQQKIAGMTPLWLEKLLSQNNSFSHEFYSQNEFTIEFCSKIKVWYNLFTTLYSLALQHQHRRERPWAQLLLPHILTSRWQPSLNISLN